MPKISISKTTVDAIEPAGRDIIYWDVKDAGFGVKVTPTGSKVYIYRYRFALPGKAEATAPKKCTIGKHGPITPDQARKLARELAARVAAGVDPREQDAEKSAAKERAKQDAANQARIEKELAFNRMADLWLDHYEHEKGRRPSSVAQAAMVVRMLKPKLGDKPMPQIGRTDLQPIIDAIPIRQKAMRRTIYAYASVLFGWAAKRGDIAHNPLADMAKPEAPKARDRVLSDDELVSVWGAATAMPAPFNSFYRLLVLTGQRRDEVAGMNWAELDRATATWVIPGNRAKNGAAHIVPLSATSVAELDQLAGISPDTEEKARAWSKKGYVLTTTGRTPVSGFSKAKRALDGNITKAREGKPLAAWRVHDIRRTVATQLQRLGVRFEVTEAVLNHISGSKGGVAGIYQRHDWAEEKRSALDAWARRLSELLKPADANNVVSLDAVKKSA